MKKVFLDCGANNGCSFRAFKEYYPDWRQYDVHCFEPNPWFKSAFQSLPVTYHPDAVWIEDGEMDFYLTGMASSTLLEEKVKAQNKQVQALVKVPTIDLSKWIMENFNKDDHIVLKLDIEGAEYELVEKMEKDGSLEYISEVHGEIHGPKCGKGFDDDMKLIRSFKDHGLDIYAWSAADDEDMTFKKNILNEEYMIKVMYPNWIRKGFTIEGFKQG
jgi:FkbM family methyltransferase